MHCFRKADLSQKDAVPWREAVSQSRVETERQSVVGEMKEKTQQGRRPFAVAQM